MGENDSKPLSLRELSEFWIKQLAALTLAISACGFLTVSLQEAKYGFLSANPLRFKIASAGFLFLVFLSVPATAGFLAGKDQHWKDEPLSERFPFRFLLLALNIELALSAVRLLLPTTRSYLLSAIPQQLSCTIGLAPFMVANTFKLSRATKRRWFNVCSLLMAATMTTQLAILRKSHDALVITLWLFAVSVATLAMRLFLDKESARAILNPTLLTAPLLLLFSFARWVYPLVEPGWGGGRLTKIQINLNKESVLPNQKINRLLIDEVDSGIYVTDSVSGDAQFVPRSTISLITYTRQDDQVHDN